MDGAAPSASIFDTALAALHSGPKLAERGSALYLYLPKMESHLEARWWDEVLSDLEQRPGSRRGPSG